MKQFTLLCTILLSVFQISAQNSDEATLGKIVYYEGKVQVGHSGEWKDVRLDGVVHKNQHIRTQSDALAEINWNNGVKTVVGPDSEISVLALMNGSSSAAKQKTEGSFTNFKQIFSNTTAQKRSQEGGIRREESTERSKPAKDELYWKESEEVAFEDAFALYESGNYQEAILSLQTFLLQKPKDEMAKFAWFALCHSYLNSNNSIKAAELMDRFLMNYPDDELAPEAERIRQALQG